MLRCRMRQVYYKQKNKPIEKAMNLLDPQLWLSLLTLTFLEIVLGVDNLVFISIVSNDVVLHKQKAARRLGLIGALGIRLIFLAGIFWIIGLTKPLFVLYGQSFSGRDIILLLGGMFLLAKGTTEIHHSIEDDESTTGTIRRKKSMLMAIFQIMVFDIIFSLDSILTAIGLTNHYWVMVTAIIISIGVMLLASEPLHRFIHTHPTIKMLALSFLLLIGLVLIADAFQYHIPREYVYFAIAFSIFVEFLNSLARHRKQKKTKALAK